MMESSGLDLLEKSSEQEAILQARAEERRQSAIQLVNSIYRLIKVLGIHAESNQAVAVLVDATLAAVRDYCERAGTSSASVLFADDTIFVNGQMLRASREAYGTAVALGGLFTKCGISEVSFQASLDASQAMEFARVLHATLRDRSLAATIVERPLSGVKLRRIDGRAKEGDDLQEAPLTERIARTYAASIVVMQVFYRELAEGDLTLPNRIKRVAQKLVKDAEEAPHVLLGLAMARASGTDGARLAVSSAALATLVAQKLTHDRALLGNVATAALLFDVGHGRLARGGELGKAGVVRVLSDTDLDRLPASTAFVHSVLGHMHTASIMRTVVSFEALWERRVARLGPVYGGRRTPTLISRLLATTRTFIDLVTPTTAAPALAIDDAMHLMMDTASTEIERACVKLLSATLGFFPVGTVVELSTGELAIVTGVPALPSDFVKPQVRLMYDEKGALLPDPRDLDLAEEPGPDEPIRYVRRTIEYDAQQMKAMRSFVLATVAGKRPAQHPALLRPTSEPLQGEDSGARQEGSKNAPASASPLLARTAVKAPLPVPTGTGPATRQVDWDDYQKLTPEPRIVHAAPPSSAGPATRQVDWNEYQKLTPEPRDIGGAPEPPPPSSPATRQVDWNDYQKLTPEPRLIAPAQALPSATRAVSWQDYGALQASTQPPSPHPAAETRAVAWDVDDVDIEPFESHASSDLPAEQDDTDLLLAGVVQDDEQPAATSDDVESLFRDYLLGNDESAPGVEPAKTPPPASASTRHIRWAATEALLSELAKEAEDKPRRPLPPRPSPRDRKPAK